MEESTPIQVASQTLGAEDAGRYFRTMSEFVGLTSEDAERIKQTRAAVEKHIPDIVGKFYAHLLRYPPTRKVFQRKDGTIDQAYLELRMRHLTNFWLRTASGEYTDDYARYIDYVGRAHTSHGADPNIYIAERYVIGQVGFVQHAISQALEQELHDQPEVEFLAEEAWDKLMMVLLEMLSRAYSNERTGEGFDSLVPVDERAVDQLARSAFQKEAAPKLEQMLREVRVTSEAELPEGERKLVEVDGISIGVFHHSGKYYAVRNSCLHRGGPVATGTLVGDVLTCPWHGFQYNVTNGQLLVDPSACLDTFGVVTHDGGVFLQVAQQKEEPEPAPAPASTLAENELRVSALPPGQIQLVRCAGQSVAVYNVEGTLYATQAECTHAEGPLDQGELNGVQITCPLHHSRFDVTNGSVLRGPAKRPLEIYQVTVQGDIARIEKKNARAD